jgi:hypothetical protein
MKFRMKFPCSKCGACCRKIGEIYPELEGPDGSCIYLSSDNLCTIYPNRPLLCNVDKFYEECLKDRMSKEEYYELNLKGCKNLQDDDKI